MGIATPTVDPSQKSKSTWYARQKTNQREVQQRAISQSNKYKEFWGDPVNMAIAMGTDMAGAFAVFTADNATLLNIFLHDNLVKGVNGAANTLAKPVAIPGLALTAGADPTLAASYTPCYEPGWSITWNADGSGTPVKA